MKRVIPKALTIAGSDSGGGAGIQADLKTFAALGVHGASVITSVTAQNTYEVKAVFDLPPEFVEAQFTAVVEDGGVEAAKTGMLGNARIVETVGRILRSYGVPTVCDPVIAAKSGAPLLTDEGVEALKKYLLPASLVVTPNKYEAERLTGVVIKSVDDAKRAAKLMVEELGARAAVVKGGHLSGDEAVDVLYYGGSFREFRSRRLPEHNTHGAGCAFSAAIAAELAKGKDLFEAIKRSKEFITMAIEFGLTVGKGYGVVNPSAWLAIPAEKYVAWQNVCMAVELIEKHGEALYPYVPEVGMNVAMAIPKPYARSLEDVVAVEGRIVRVAGRVRAVSAPRFGASRHLARAILKAMEFDPRIRAAVNAAYDEDLIKAAIGSGFTVSYYDRAEEPPEVRGVEGASIPWGVEVAVKKVGFVPDIIFHRGGWGKEPMINIFGESAVEAVNKLLKLVKEVRASK